MALGRIPESEQEPNIAGFEFYIEAFKELGSCRPVGMGLGQIPFTAILEYYKLYPVGSVYEFWHIIRQMDNAFLTLQAEKEKGKAKNG